MLFAYLFTSGNMRVLQIVLLAYSKCGMPRWYLLRGGLHARRRGRSVQYKYTPESCTALYRVVNYDLFMDEIDAVRCGAVKLAVTRSLYDGNKA